MAYEKEIQALKAQNDARNRAIAAYSEKREHILAEIDKVRGGGLCPRVRKKMFEVCDAIRAAASSIMEEEARVKSFHNRYTEAVKKAPRGYDKDRFLEELENAYRQTVKFAGLLNTRGIRYLSAEQVNTAAKSYAVSEEIRAHADELLKALDEEDLRSQSGRLEGLQAQADEAERDHRAFLAADEKDFFKLLQDLKDKIKRDEAAACGDPFPPVPVLPDKIPEEVTLPLGIAEKAEAKKQVYRFDAYRGEELTVPSLPYLYKVRLGGDSGNMLITYDEDLKDSTAVWNAIEAIVMKFVLCYPAWFKNVAAIHSVKTGSGFVDLMGKLKLCCNNGELLFDSHNTKGVANTYEEIDRTLRTIAGFLDERRGKIYGYDDVLQYNRANSDNIQPLTLLIVKDIDVSRNREEMDYIRSIAENGNRVGVYLLFLGEESSVKELWGDALETAFPYRFQCLKGGDLKGENSTIDVSRGLGRLNTAYYESIAAQAKKYVTAIDLWEFERSQEGIDTSGFSECLNIPIGKQGASPVFLSLNSKSELCNAVLAGAVGTGKSSLLHSIILGTAYHYSPEQVEIWLLDFKQGGVEFQRYSELKHVRMLALNSDVQDVYDLLDFLDNRIREYGEKFNERGVSNLVSYNALGGEMLPRILVVIDEYDVLKVSKSCILKLERLASKGRAYGLSLIMSSQIYENTYFDHVVAQMKHWFEFSKDKNRTLIREDVSRFGDLSSAPSGTCLYQKRNEIIQMRVAYAREGSIPEIIDKINARWENSPAKEVIQLGEPHAVERTAAFGGPGSVGKYTDGTMRVCLGERYLSHAPVEYKIDRNNRLLFILGNERRAKNIEYGIIEAHAALHAEEPVLFYLNTSAYTDDIISRMRTEHPDPSVSFTNKPLEIGTALHSLYDLLQRRMDRLYDGEEIRYPLEVVIHSCDKLPMLLERCAARQDEETAEDTFTPPPIGGGTDPSFERAGRGMVP